MSHKPTHTPQPRRKSRRTLRLQLRYTFKRGLDDELLLGVDQNAFNCGGAPASDARSHDPQGFLLFLNRRRHGARGTKHGAVWRREGKQHLSKAAERTIKKHSWELSVWCSVMCEIDEEREDMKEGRKERRMGVEYNKAKASATFCLRAFLYSASSTAQHSTASTGGGVGLACMCVSFLCATG